MLSPRLPPLRVTPHRFIQADLCAGHVVLDFVNTAAGLNRDPRDWLADFDSLLEWAHAAGLLEAGRLADMNAQACSEPDSARHALERARELRAALYILLHHRRLGTRPPSAAVKALERWRRKASAALLLRAREDGRLVSALGPAGLDAIAATVAIEAVDLLSSPFEGVFGVCAGHNCGWLFLDASPSRRRRWCNMATCGNAAKAGRHYRRQRAAASSGMP